MLDTIFPDKKSQNPWNPISWLLHVRNRSDIIDQVEDLMAKLDIHKLTLTIPFSAVISEAKLQKHAPKQQEKIGGTSNVHHSMLL